MQYDSKLPHIYGLPKIHKDSIPFRPIVRNRGSACHPLSWFLVDIVSLLTVKSSSYAYFMEKNLQGPYSLQPDGKPRCSKPIHKNSH